MKGRRGRVNLPSDCGWRWQTFLEEGQEELFGTYVKFRNIAPQRWSSVSSFLDRVAENIDPMDQAYYQAKKSALATMSVHQELLEVGAIMRSMVALTKDCQMDGVPTAGMALHLLVGKRTGVLNSNTPLSVIDPQDVKKAKLNGR